MSIETWKTKDINRGVLRREASLKYRCRTRKKTSNRSAVTFSTTSSSYMGASVCVRHLTSPSNQSCLSCLLLFCVSCYKIVVMSVLVLTRLSDKHSSSFHRRWRQRPAFSCSCVFSCANFWQLPELGNVFKLAATLRRRRTNREVEAKRFKKSREHQGKRVSTNC